MKKRLLLCLTYLCLTHCGSTLAQGNTLTVERYGHLPFRETPFADIRGSYPMTEGESRTRKHFELTKDPEGRVIEMKFKQGEKVVPLNVSRNAVTHSSHVKIRYEGNQEIRTYFDTEGNPTLANGVYKSVFTLDNYGNRTSLSFMDFEGKQIESSWGVYRYDWTVDKRGTVTEQRFDKTGKPVSIRPGFPFYCLKLHYDQRGLLALMENYGLDCKQLTLNELNGAQDKLEYDDRGSMIAWNVYDDKEQRSAGNGPKVARGLMTPDVYGNTIREYYQDPDGQPMTSAYGWTDTYAEFDAHGNMTSRFNFDTKGKLLNNPTLGYAGYRLTYDDKGLNRLTLEYFDEDNQPAVHQSRGYHAVKHHYDNAGRVSHISFLDVEGQLVNRVDRCFAELHYAYDELGRRVKVSLTDKDGMPVKDCRQDWTETHYEYYPNGPLKNTTRK